MSGGVKRTYGATDRRAVYRAFRRRTRRAWLGPLLARGGGGTKLRTPAELVGAVARMRMGTGQGFAPIWDANRVGPTCRIRRGGRVRPAPTTPDSPDVWVEFGGGGCWVLVFCLGPRLERCSYILFTVKSSLKVWIQIWFSNLSGNHQGFLGNRGNWKSRAPRGKFYLRNKTLLRT